MKALYICCIDSLKSGDPVYDPNIKVVEFKEALESKFCSLYIPGRNLSVDETLLRAYGRIGFKMRVVTKAARYGIKMYVATDAIDE